LVDKAYADKIAPSLSSAQIIVGNSTNTAQARNVTGDVTISDAGVTTIGDNKVTTTKIKPGTVNQVLVTNASGVTEWQNGNGRYVDRVSDQNIKGVKTFSSDTAFVVTGTFNSGSTTIATPVIGAGTRMMWYAKKAAFRAGRAVGNDWDDANIGSYSMAMGYSAIAGGNNSVALGSFVDDDKKPGSFVFGDFTSTQVLKSTANNQMSMRFTGGYKFFVNDISSKGLELTTDGVARYLGDYTANFNNRSLVDKAYVDTKAPSLTDGQILIGNASNLAAAVLPTGDVTITNAGVTTIGNNKVVTDKIADGNVTDGKLASSTTSDANRAVGTNHIKDGSVTDGKLASSTTSDANRAVGTNHIKDGSVTDGKLASSTTSDAGRAVGTNHIKEGSVTDGKLASSTTSDAGRAVGTDHIKDGNITTAKLALNAVVTEKITDGNVTEVKLGGDAVTSAKIKDGEVKTADIADKNVTTAKIAFGTPSQVLVTNTAGDAVEWAATLTKIAFSTNKTLTAAELPIGRNVMLQNTSTTSSAVVTLPSGYTFSNTSFGNTATTVTVPVSAGVTLYAISTSSVEVIGSNIPIVLSLAPEAYHGKLSADEPGYVTRILSIATAPALYSNILTASGTSDIVLKANHTYSLEATLSSTSGSGDQSYVYYQWYRAGQSGIPAGNIGIEGLAIATTHSGTFSPAPASAIITIGSADEKVQLRTTNTSYTGSAATLMTIGSRVSQFKIVQIK